MIFTAKFDTPDSADLCAAALREKLSSISSVKVSYNNEDSENNTKKSTIYPAFNQTSNNPQYNYPLIDSQYAANNADNGEYSYSSRNHTDIQVICSKDEKKAVSNIIVGFGGTKIRHI